MAEWYVSSLAGGGGAGTEPDPWTLAEMFTAIQGGTVLNGDRCNVKADGIYTQPDVVITRDAAANSRITIQGYTAAIGDGGRPTIQRTGGEVGSWIDFVGAQYYNFWDLVLDVNNVGDSVGVALFSHQTNYHWNMELKNGNHDYLARNGFWFNCYFHDTTESAAIIGTYTNCMFVNMGGIGVGSCTLVNCIVRDAGTWLTYSCDHYNCILDGAGGNFGAVNTSDIDIVNCVILNVNGNGITDNTGGAKIINCDFWNCNVNYSGNPTVLNEYNLDPEFADPANLDYTRTGSNLDGIGLSVIGLQAEDYNISIGPYNPAVVGVTLPLASQVLLGVVFGYDGAQQTGTLEAVNLQLPLDVVVEDDDLNVETSGEELEVEISV